ncbi:MAG: hypothetical protein A2X13_08605 [Bacteroidetes bacterium GWC2_33_15]|nr:MAG: hypothetical protein A2X10_10435 [Bacteroidetes bacterium GWA2_33_15]OFX51511.1 MAG: hypothetical protein A2X13_08605 [Bacteroidetes bacterium GWC2_33_15]OFX65742.1 MAG: hypothetical protein A2X15_13170 [Bacteroidetes bacterium GWB2_32_14]OFX69147.1 MAG: hypothetical protein A2X14_13885 [Bacteroidetes bacterium GWD2_33_33]HAN17798.1 hypothetical protein [Bacteroidales bacterium]
MRIKYRYFKSFIVVIFVLKVSLLFSQVVYKGSDTRLYPDFYILESEFSEGKYIQGNITEQGFQKYNFKETPNTRPANDRMLTLRSNLIIDSSNIKQDLYLVVMPVDYPCAIFLNGNLIGFRGNIKNGYTNRIHYSESIFLPPDFILYNKINDIAIQLYPKEGEINSINRSFISKARDASYYVFLRNFWGIKLTLALTFCGLIFFVYYLFTYLSRADYKKQSYLFFALMNFFFFISIINNIFTYNFTNTFIVEIISRVGFQLAMIFCLFFLFEYTGILLRFHKKIKIFILIIYLPAIALLLVQHNLSDLLRANNTYPITMLVIGELAFAILSAIYFIKEKSVKSLFLLLVFAFNFFAGMHDTYFFAILKVKPFVLFTPYSVFLMNLVIFFVLAVDHTKIYHLAISNSKQLKSLNENLELMVAERTKKIVEYTHKLEEANTTKDKFFSIIAHDLKNPFNTLIGYSELLKSEFRDMSEHDIHDQLNIIYATSKNGYVLLDNLLQWAQTQTNQISFNPEEIQLKKLTQVCIENIENQSRFKDIEVINNVPEDIVIKGDQNQIKTILRNLICNAVKYTARNGLIIIKSEKSNSDIMVSVRDTGVGMSEKDIQDLFRIDKMFSKPGTNHERGSGLGLILCKEFVEKHNGKIWVESIPGYGSNFKFTIPVK